MGCSLELSEHPGIGADVDQAYLDKYECVKV